MAKFIRLSKDTEVTHEGKPVYWILNKRAGASIGQLFWYTPWRKWCARFKEDTVWSEDCLADVRKFIRTLEDE